MNVAEAIQAASDSLSPAERRVAKVVTRDPEAVAFGTAAGVAELAGTSAPTVVRFAERTGFDGFVGLQAAVQDQLSDRLKPAVQRIRAEPSAPALTRTLEAELANVANTLQGIDSKTFSNAVERLSNLRRRVAVIPSEQCRAQAAHFCAELQILRDGVSLIGGSEFRVVTRLTALRFDDTAVLIDLQRHERWLLETSKMVAERGMKRIVICDSPLSPLAAGAEMVMTVSAAAAGPFDSSIGVVALLNAITAGIADRCRGTVTRRLDALETMWSDSGALVE